MVSIDHCVAEKMNGLHSEINRGFVMSAEFHSDPSPERDHSHFENAQGMLRTKRKMLNSKQRRI
jgi:hypothetical protein